MTTLTEAQKVAFQKDLLNLMLCRETQHFVNNEKDYADEPDERLEEFYETLCDPSYENCTSDWALEKLKAPANLA